MWECHHPRCQHPLRVATATENVSSRHGGILKTDREWYKFICYGQAGGSFGFGALILVALYDNVILGA
jgi:hypothetical protein